MPETEPQPTTPPSPKPKLADRLEARREAYQERGRVYRVAWVTAGVIVVVAGLAMTVLPGPAVVVIPVGLAMLSFEFAWAQRLLDRGLEDANTAKERVLRASAREKVLGLVAIACLAAAAIWVAVAILT